MLFFSLFASLFFFTLVSTLFSTLDFHEFHVIIPYQCVSFARTIVYFSFLFLFLLLLFLQFLHLFLVLLISGFTSLFLFTSLTAFPVLFAIFFLTFDLFFREIFSLPSLAFLLLSRCLCFTNLQILSFSFNSLFSTLSTCILSIIFFLYPSVSLCSLFRTLVYVSSCSITFCPHFFLCLSCVSVLISCSLSHFPILFQFFFPFSLSCLPLPLLLGFLVSITFISLTLSCFSIHVPLHCASLLTPFLFTSLSSLIFSSIHSSSAYSCFHFYTTLFFFSYPFYLTMFFFFLLSLILLSSHSSLPSFLFIFVHLFFLCFFTSFHLSSFASAAASSHFFPSLFLFSSFLSSSSSPTTLSSLPVSVFISILNFSSRHNVLLFPVPDFFPCDQHKRDNGLHLVLLCFGERLTCSGRHRQDEEYGALFRR